MGEGVVGESLKNTGGVWCNPDLGRATSYNQGVVLGLQAVGVALSTQVTRLMQTAGPAGAYPAMDPLGCIGRVADRTDKGWAVPQEAHPLAHHRLTPVPPIPT